MKSQSHKLVQKVHKISPRPKASPNRKIWEKRVQSLFHGAWLGRTILKTMHTVSPKFQSIVKALRYLKPIMPVYFIMGNILCHAVSYPILQFLWVKSVSLPYLWRACVGIHAISGHHILKCFWENEAT